MKLPVIVSVSKYELQIAIPGISRPYTAYCPFFPTIRSNGASPEEAISRLQKHLKSETFQGEYTLTEIEV